MEITLAEVLQVVPGLVYAILVVLIYRDGAKQIEARMDKEKAGFERELDRFNAVHNARVEALQEVIDRLMAERPTDLLSRQLKEIDEYLRSNPKPKA